MKISTSKSHECFHVAIWLATQPSPPFAFSYTKRALAFVRHSAGADHFLFCKCCFPVHAAPMNLQSASSEHHDAKELSKFVTLT